MTEHDDTVSRRYRELGGEEPPAALDEAILSASRRAVNARSGRHWAGPLSIAAVLLLGIGLSLRMQMEQPGVETSVPSSEPYIPPPAPALAPASGPELRAQSRSGERDRSLQRIARLRSEGRHAEADAALEEFRRQHPGYRIPEGMWEQVKPR